MIINLSGPSWFIPWTRVVNKFKEPFDVYIGRPGPWGNPFPLGSETSRQFVIDQYENWLMSKPSLISKAKRELSGKVLGCYCKPRACHGDVLARVCWDADHGRRADELYGCQISMPAKRFIDPHKALEALLELILPALLRFEAGTLTLKELTDQIEDVKLRGRYVLGKIGRMLCVIRYNGSHGAWRECYGGWDLVNPPDRVWELPENVEDKI
jgi:hypothetical protein